MPCYCWRGNHGPSAGHDPPLFPQQDSCSHWATCPQQGNLVPDGPLMTKDFSLTAPPALPWGSETQHSSSSFCFYLPIHSFSVPPYGCFAFIHPPNAGAPWFTLSPFSFPNSSSLKTPVTTLASVAIYVPRMQLSLPAMTTTRTGLPIPPLTTKTQANSMKQGLLRPWTTGKAGR